MADLPSLASLPALGAKTAARSKKRKRQDDGEPRLSDIPKLTPEQEQSLLSRALGGGVSGLQWLGETLDKPRRALYGALAGRREALNFIPFSDTLGITDPEETITGRDALEAAGILGKNKPGLDMGDVAGFLFELPTDPANLIGLGLAGKAAKGAKAGVSAAGRLDDIAKGAESIARLTTPDLGIPLTKIKTKPRTILEFTGPQAAKVYEGIHYGKYSPVPYLRKVFSASEEIAQAPVKQQKAIDLKLDMKHAMEQAAQPDMLELLKLERQAQEATSKLRTRAILGDDMNIARNKAKIVSELAGTNPEFKQMVDKRLAGFNRSDAASVAPEAIADNAIQETAKFFDDVTDAQKGYGEVGVKLKNAFTATREELAKGMQNAPPGEQHLWQDMLADLGEANDLNPEAFADLLVRNGYSKNLQDVAEFKGTVDAYEQLAMYMRKKTDEYFTKMRDAGIKIGKFDNPFFAYQHRSATKAYAKDAADIAAHRTGMLGNLKRSVVNAMSRQLAGLNKNKKLADEWVAGLDQNTLDAMKTEFVPSKNSPAYKLYEAAKAEGVSYKDALDAAMSARSGAREKLQFIKDAYLDVAESYYGKNFAPYLRGVATKAGANFDPNSIPRFDQVVQSIANRLGREVDGALESEVFDILTHPQPVSRFKPKKLSDPEAIRDAIDTARSIKKQRDAANLADAGDSFNPAMFGGEAPTAATKFSKELVAEFLKKNGLPSNENFTANVRKTMAMHSDPELAAIARDSALTDDAFTEAIYNLAGNRGELQNLEGVDDAVEYLDHLVNKDPFLKGSGGYSQSEIVDLADWFTKLPESVRTKGFFDRDVTMDVIDYYQQANRKLAHAAVVRSFFQDPQFVGTLNKDGRTISVLDAWRAADMTDEGLLDLMARRRGQSYQDFIKGKSPAEVKASNESLMKDAAALGVDPGMAMTIARTNKVFSGNNQSSWLGSMADRLRSIIQGSLYTPFMASHVRNKISAAAINMIGGVIDASSFNAAEQLVRGKNLADPEMRDVLEDIITSGLLKTAHPSGYDALELVETLRRAVNNPESAIEAKGLLASLYDPIKLFTGQVANTYRTKGLKSAAKQALIGGDGNTGIFNFWEVRAGISPGDAAKNVGATNPDGTTKNFWQRAKSEETRVLPMQLGEAAGRYVEFTARVAPFIYLRRQGWSAHAAAMKVKELHFDYGNLNSFEKKVLRRHVLFYDFMRKNLELQFNLLVQAPGGATAQIVRAENRLQDEAKSADGYIPGHLREGFTVRLPGEVPGFPGTSRFWNQSGLLPIEEAVGRFQFNRDGFPLNAKRTAEKFAAQLAPWFTIPAESFSGKQLATGRPLKDLYRYPSGDPDIDFWLQKSPASRVISTYRTLTDERKSLPQKAFNLTVGGARLTDVDVPLQKALEGRRAVQENLSRDQDISTYEALYAKDLKNLIERSKQGDASALMQLQLYQQLRNAVRELRSDREKNRPVTAK